MISTYLWVKYNDVTVTSLWRHFDVTGMIGFGESSPNGHKFQLFSGEWRILIQFNSGIYSNIYIYIYIYIFGSHHYLHVFMPILHVILILMFEKIYNVIVTVYYYCYYRYYRYYQYRHCFHLIGCTHILYENTEIPNHVWERGNAKTSSSFPRLQEILPVVCGDL